MKASESPEWDFQSGSGNNRVARRRWDFPMRPAGFSSVPATRSADARSIRHYMPGKFLPLFSCVIENAIFL